MRTVIGSSTSSVSTTALRLLAGACWLLALVAAVAFPWLFAVLVLVVVYPLVVAIPHVGARDLFGFLVVGMATLAATGVIAISNDDGGLVDDVDETVELVAVSGGLALLGLVIALTIRRNNTTLRGAMAEAVASRRRIVSAADEERSRIERDLHDGAQQRIVAVSMQIRRLAGAAESQGLDLSDDLSSVAEDLGDALSELRALSHGISPPLLEMRGLGEALAAAARRAANEVTTDLQLPDRFDRAIETAVYFCATEALTNADKHAPGARVVLDGHVADGNVIVAVRDDGPGFAGGATESRGVTNMADRLAVVDGTLTIDSAPGEGTIITATAPATPPVSPAGADPARSLTSAVQA